MPMDEEFTRNVMAAIASVHAQGAAIADRLDKQNGSIEKLFERSEANRLAIATHPGECEAKKDVDVMKAQLGAGVAVKDFRGKVLGELRPAIWVLIVWILLVLFEHSSIGIKLLTVK